jgi:adenylate cyclase
MSEKILVVDDNEKNVRLLADILEAKGYSAVKSESGEKALELIESESPDLVLLDVMMPGLDGYEVCRTIRASPKHSMLPVVMVTALDVHERVKGLEAGADDFLTKPVHQAELLARVKSLLRIKTLYDQVERQRAELESWNQELEQRVSDGIAEVERMSRMKRFLSPQVVDLILSGQMEDPLRTHRADITVVFVDLRGFSLFTETADPEEVMAVLREYHASMGALVMAHDGTIQQFAADGIMICFNDPIPLPNPAENAIRMALEMHRRFAQLRRNWARRGYELQMGIGIAQGYATIGTIGFEGRMDYGAVGTVANLAARLCAEAKGEQTLISQRVLARVEQLVKAEHVGDFTLKGFRRPLPVFNVMSIT